MVLALPACERREEPIDTTLPKHGYEVEKAREEIVGELPMAEQLTVAFQAAFGKAGPATRTIEGDTLTYRPKRLLWLGDIAVLVSTGKNRNECHACTGALSIHYLRPAGAGFKVIKSWMRAAGNGDWGTATDKFSISQEFSRYPVIITEDSSGGQGYVCGAMEMVELRSEGPSKWDAIPNIYSDVGNKGEEEGSEINGAVANVRKDVSFDLVFTGDDSFIEHYERRGNKFVRTSSGSKLPTC